MTNGKTISRSAERYLSIAICVALFMAGLVSLLLVQDAVGIVVILLLFILSCPILWRLIGRHRGNSIEELLPAALILGISLPLVNIFGSGALLALECLYLALVIWRIPIACAWGFPWLLVLTASVAAEVLYAFDLPLLISLLQSPTLIAEHARALHQSPPIWLQSGLHLLRWIGIVMMVSLLSESALLRARICYGIALGLAGATVVALFHVALGEHSHLVTQAAYWQALGRYAASFSDPNAFGLVALLVLGLAGRFYYSDLPRTRRYFLLAVVMIFVLLGIVLSGSRSLLLGIGLLACLTLPVSRKVWLVGAFLLAVSFVSFRALPFERIETVTHLLPGSVERVVRSLHPETASEALSSRAKFFRLGYVIWRDNSLFGVGLGRFRESVPTYAERAGISMGGWIDNANNFYLGILAELGLLGLIALSWVVLRMRWSDAQPAPEQLISRKMVLCFMVVLVTGPHLDFDEVALLFSLLLAETGVFVPLRFSWRNQTLFAAVVLPMLLLVRGSNSYGLYAPEHSEQGAFAWSGRRTQLKVECEGSGHTQLRYQSLDPRNGADPLLLDISIDSHRVREQVVDNAMHTLTIRCQKSPAGDRYLPARVQVSLSRTFTPALNPAQPDYRQLGIRLFAHAQ